MCGISEMYEPGKAEMCASRPGSASHATSTYNLAPEHKVYN